MTLHFGIRPFEFQDFIGMIGEKGKLDISSVSYVDVVKDSLQNKFDHFEVTGDLAYVLPGLLSKDVINQLTEFKNRNKLSCSVHLPLWAIELSSPNNHIKNASIKCLVDTIEQTRELDPICWVIHATGALISEFSRLQLPHYAKSFMTGMFASTAQKSLEQIIDQTNISPRKLAVENVEFPFREMEECIEALDLSVCFDTGHLLAGYSGEWEGGVIDFFDTYHDRIVELHLHDGKIPRIDHIPLGEGDLPVQETIETLLEVNFAGPIVFELDLDEVEKSMMYIKENVPGAL
ncbi:MAG: TIM barrel protein [Candidatus Heimdallarchaeota archaeon]|nr:MAG: TIM barrel protein [Candidatus Heimdallarchaeota archaeon]